jgi:hypothetical protein
MTRRNHTPRPKRCMTGVRQIRKRGFKLRLLTFPSISAARMPTATRIAELARLALKHSRHSRHI